MPPFYADLHIHSKYSRACSRDCDLEHLALVGRRKGISVIGTGDFTHPEWFEELSVDPGAGRAGAVPAAGGPGAVGAGRGCRRAAGGRCGSCCRWRSPPSTSGPSGPARCTTCSTCPTWPSAARCTAALARIGNLASDGRPILGLDSRDLLEITLESGDGAYLVPAHVWTPWFSALGSKSGFDPVEDCYADLAGHIFALETGLSSDPEMNWRVSGLDRYRLVSNSDAHSPPALGREATVLDTELDYYAIRRALETGEGFDGTVEFFPEEGKYHLDGHRKCGVRMEPAETRRHGGRCPVCGKPLTVGVLHRVEELADRPEGARPAGAAGFRNLIQLPELVGEVLGRRPEEQGGHRRGRPAWSTGWAPSWTSWSGSRPTRSPRPARPCSPRPSTGCAAAPSSATPATTASTAPSGSSPPTSSARRPSPRSCSTSTPIPPTPDRHPDPGAHPGPGHAGAPPPVPGPPERDGTPTPEGVPPLSTPPSPPTRAARAEPVATEEVAGCWTGSTPSSGLPPGRRRGRCWWWRGRGRGRRGR